MSKMSQMKLDALERFATSFRADFRFAPLNIMILVALCLAGLVIHLAVYPFRLEAVITMIGVAMGLAMTFRLMQIWEAVVIFTTGLGTPIGNAIAPVIKLGSNSAVLERMPEDIDLSAGSVVEGTETIEQVGERVFDYMLKVSGGEIKAKAEINAHRDFQIWGVQQVTL